MRRGWKVSGEIRFLWGRIKYICENWKGIQLFYLGRDTLKSLISRKFSTKFARFFEFENI